MFMTLIPACFGAAVVVVEAMAVLLSSFELLPEALVVVTRLVMLSWSNESATRQQTAGLSGSLSFRNKGPLVPESFEAAVVAVDVDVVVVAAVVVVGPSLSSPHELSPLLPELK